MKKLVYNPLRECFIWSAGLLCATRDVSKEKSFGLIMISVSANFSEQYNFFGTEPWRMLDSNNLLLI